MLHLLPQTHLHDVQHQVLPTEVHDAADGAGADGSPRLHHSAAWARRVERSDSGFVADA